MYKYCHCVKSVPIQRFSGPNTGKYIPEKLRIWTLFMSCVGKVLLTHFRPQSLLNSKLYITVFGGINCIMVYSSEVEGGISLVEKVEKVN